MTAAATAPGAPDPRVDRLAGRALFAAAFVLYAFAAAPGNEWLDAGELCAAGFTLGVSHPPAQPGHALLVKAASLVPVGEIAFRASLLSALAAALAVRGVLALARALLPPGRATMVAGVAAAVLVGLAPLGFAQATRPEVYAPVLALTTWSTAWVIAFVRSGDARPALAAGFGFALAATIHPLVAAMAALPCAAALAWRARARLVRLAPAAAALGGLALVTYAYLPLRAAAPARALLVWGEPDSWARFVDVVSARAYGGNFAGAGIGERAAGHVLLLGEGVGLPLVLLGGAGLVFAAATRLRGALALLAGVALLVLGAASQRVFYPDNPDVHGYLAPALPLLGAGLAALLVGIGRAIARAQARLPEAAVVALLALPAFLIATAAPVVHAGDTGFRRGDDVAAWIDATLGRVPPGPAVFVAESDHTLFPLQYERFVAGDRPDVAIANLGLTRSSWFLRLIKRQQPRLFVPYVDDGGQRGALAERFLAENLRAGRPVWGEHPPAAPLRGDARGFVYAYALPGGAVAPEATAGPAAAPPRYHGAIGARVGRHAGLVRARFEAGRGRWLEAVRAAGALAAFDDAGLARLAAVPPGGAPPLFLALPRPTPVFIFAAWQAELVARDAGFAAGLGAGAAPAPGAPFELRLLHAWHLLLVGDAAAEPALAALGVEARVATGHMLIARGQAALAEPQLRAALARAPAHATAWKHLGVALALTRRIDEARGAWQRSLELDPRQPEVARWLADSLKDAAPAQNQNR